MRCSTRALLALPVLLALGAAGCGPSAVSGGVATGAAPSAPDLQARAAAEATAIIQQAQATAVMLKAQAQATALIEQALAQAGQAAATPLTRVLPAALPTPMLPDEELPAPPLNADPGPDAPTTATVELLGVGFGAEGTFIHVSFRAPPVVVHTFWPGVLSVVDEASGTVFAEVPVMPVVGPLIGRPVEEGQPGYVMFVHVPAILRPGSLVTVHLADYTFEHVTVQ